MFIQLKWTSWHLLIIYSLIVCIIASSFVDALSDKRLCADEKCSVTISVGTIVLTYRAGELGMLSVKQNSIVNIKSKGSGSEPGLWGIEINGHHGYLNKKFIKETKIFIPDDKLVYVVDVPSPNTLLTTSEKSPSHEVNIETQSSKPLESTTIPVAISEASTSTKFPNASKNTSNRETTPITQTSHPEIVDGTAIAITHETTTAMPNNQTIATTSGNHVENKNENTGENKNANDTKDDDVVVVKDDLVKKQIGDETTMKQNESLVEIKGNLSEEKKLGEGSTSPPLTTSPTLMENTTINNLLNPEVVSKEPNLAVPEVNNDSSIKASNHADGGTVTSNKIASEEENANQTSDDMQKDQLPDGIVSINKNSKEINLNGIRSSYDLLQQQTTTLLTKNSQQLENQVKAKDIKFQHSVEKSHLQTHNTTNVTNDTKPSNSNTKDHEEHLLTGTIVPPNVEMETNAEQILSNTSHSHSNIQRETTISENSNKTSAHVENEQILNVTTTISTIIDSLKNETTVTPSPTDNRDLDKNTSNETLYTAAKGEEKPISSTPKADNRSTETHNNSQYQKSPFAETETTASPTFHKISLTSANNPPESFKVNDESTEPLVEVKNEIITERTLYENTTIPSINDSINNNTIVTASPATNPVNVSVFSNIQDTSADISTPPIAEDKAKEKTDKISGSHVYHAFNSNAFNYIKPSEERPSDVSTEINITSEPEGILNDTTPTFTDIDTKTNDINSLILESSTSTHSIDTTDTTYVLKDNNDFNKETIETINKSFVKLIESSTTASSDTTIKTDTDTVTDNNVPSISSPLAVEQFVTTLQTLADDAFFSPPEMATISPLTEQTTTSPSKVNQEIKEKGLFATILGTVNNFISSDRKVSEQIAKHDDELHQMLYGDIKTQSNEVSEGYCENLGPRECPHSVSVSQTGTKCNCPQKSIDMEEDGFNVNYFLEILASKILDASELLTFLIVAAGASLFFIFGYYCFCNSSREGALLSKLNQLESSLLASHKENCILKHNLVTTRQKLTCIEDNSFGSNDMVASLKKELEEELTEKDRLKEQIVSLQKELETAADAGIELNKIVADLLSNQTGDESILSSVENLQKQLNEQQNIIMEINASLADKSRENSELQLLVREQNTRYEMEIANLRRDNDELEAEKDNLLGRLNEVKNDFDRDMTAALESKNYEIKRLQNEIVEFKDKLEKEHGKWQTSSAKVEALEDCLKNIKRNPKMNIKEVIDMANIKAEVLDAQKKYQTVSELLTSEMDGRKLAENQIQLLNTEVQKLKRDFNQSEKDKLEAQTRLEVLSNYFKEKENQLQKELSLKETMWLKQQGETTTTVERLTTMKDEIQSLKSQNDALRAEIEAQIAAHKAQIGTLENRAHETWLAARQSDRRCEEARAEASALRRQLTALAGNPANEVNRGIGGLEELANAPSPLHIEAPNSPLLGRMPPPPPPPFLPPPFMGPPPAFMGMPPPPPPAPPFVQAGEMRPAPLGRIMSPLPFKRSRFSPQHFDYEDYLDHERDASWPRHTFSPAARSYRSLSPTDSRYNYGNERGDIHSIYDTETDFSPPSSPQLTRRLHRDNNQQVIYSNNKINNDKIHSATAKSKRVPSSGSDRSYNSSVRNNQHQSAGSGKSFV